MKSPLYLQVKPVTHPLEYYVTQYLNYTQIDDNTKSIIFTAILRNANLRQQLSKELGVAYVTTKNITDSIFGSSSVTTRFKTRILNSFNIKQCGKCRDLLDKSFFDTNNSRPDKLQSMCKFCKSQWIHDNKSYYAEISSNRRNQIISIAYKKQLIEFYKKCPLGYEVDHIIPINNDIVCGLHVPWNLQYLPWKENRTKSNKFDAR